MLSQVEVNENKTFLRNLAYIVGVYLILSFKKAPKSLEVVCLIKRNIASIEIETTFWNTAYLVLPLNVIRWQL